MLHIIEIFQIIISQASFLQNLVSYRTWSHCKLLVILYPVAFVLMIYMAGFYKVLREIARLFSMESYLNDFLGTVLNMYDCHH